MNAAAFDEFYSSLPDSQNDRLRNMYRVLAPLLPSLSILH
jgi:hypothetical protein